MKTLNNIIIITTRPLSEQDDIKNALSEKGATVLDFPMIEIEPVKISNDYLKVLQNMDAFHWLIFTSRNGVFHFFRIINKINLTLPKMAVIGETTAKEVLKNNYVPSYISSGKTSGLFVKELKNKFIYPGDSVLLILGEMAGTEIEDELAEIAKVQRMNVYKTKETVSCSEKIVEMIRGDEYDMIIFTSPSGFRNFSRIMNEKNIHKNFRIACIGETTNKEIIIHGQKPLVVASKPQSENFVIELETFLTQK